jgi:hypothetical protein
MAELQKSLTETLVDNLRNGSAAFEFVSPEASLSSKLALPFASISSVFGAFTAAQSSVSSLFFARMELPRRGTPPAMKKIEHFSVQKVRGDGRCMFRSLVKGMATNKGLSLSPREEEEDADELRIAVSEAVCGSEKERRTYEEALIAITVEESLKQYCQKIQHPNFWGGESELLVLSKMLSQPIIVYIPESEAKQGGKWGTGFIPIAEYGEEFMKPSKQRKGRKPVRLLYSGSNHYDLLI